MSTACAVFGPTQVQPTGFRRARWIASDHDRRRRARQFLHAYNSRCTHAEREMAAAVTAGAGPSVGMDGLSRTSRDAIAVAAVRYALGRMTYIVADVARAVPDLELSGETRALLAREISEALDGGWTGWRIDVEEWERCRARLLGEPESPPRRPETHTPSEGGPE